MSCVGSRLCPWVLRLRAGSGGSDDTPPYNPRMDGEIVLPGDTLQSHPHLPGEHSDLVVTPDAPLRAGDRLGHYRFQYRLGRGGMGEVFLAWDERLERHVAIKRIRSDRSFGARQRARFRREARAIARLSHPVIVQVFDLVDAAGGDYLVMEYVEGTRLDRLVAEIDGGLELGLALGLAAELADGLSQV